MWISQRDICIPKFTAALLTTAKMWKQPICPLMNEWIKEVWYVYIYNGILFRLKKKEILSYATAWMTLKDMILSELSQTQTNTA